MKKKNFYCEKLNALEQDEVFGGSWGGTDEGGPDAGGGDDTVCVCACGGWYGMMMDLAEEAFRKLIEKQDGSIFVYEEIEGKCLINQAGYELCLTH